MKMIKGDMACKGFRVFHGACSRVWEEILPMVGQPGALQKVFLCRRRDQRDSRHSQRCKAVLAAVGLTGARI
jgi:hypothetical protein